MKSPLVLLAAVFLSSCVHTAISPVANPQGVPVVVRVPGVRAGQKATKAQIAAIDAKVEKEMQGNKPADAKPDPGIVSVGVVGVFGDMKTKSGEKFVGYSPFVVVRSVYPEEAVDRGAGLMAAAYYRGAKKHFQLIPITDIASQPKKSKP